MSFNNKQNRAKTASMTKEQQEANLASWVYTKFKEAMVAKSEETKKWQNYIDAYYGDYFLNINKPEYKSDQISNFIFSTIETIRPIMTDNNPKFIAMPRNPNGTPKANTIQMALDYEWDREKMQTKLPRGLLTSLQIGTIVYGLFWNGRDQNGLGNVKCVLINPFNIFPDPLATDFDDAEYIIYATYKHVNKLKQNFPDKASLLEGGNINYEELVANRGSDVNVTNQVLILEMWCRDYTTVEIEEIEDGVQKKKFVPKFPRGRVITVAPELNLVLRDIENPYRDGKFPFVAIKDYDVPFRFWGEGEVAQLLSPQKYINELNNQVIDNAKLTANMPWIIDKNSGIGKGKLTNRPGLVVRKNPGTEVKRESPPSMPAYINQKIIELKTDIETVSGVHDVTQGKRAVGVVAASAIMALQEAGQARIRLKVRIMETALSEMATMWYSRMQQFWLLERWVRVVDHYGNVNFQQVTPQDLSEDMDIQITAGSTMPTNKNAMLDLVIRMAQTPAEDGLPMVDRQTVLEFIPIADKKQVLERIEAFKQRQMQEQMMAQQQAMMQEQMMAQQAPPQSQPAPPQPEVIQESGVMAEQPQQLPIDDEMLEMINNLPKEELLMLLQEYPELEQALQQM